LTKYQIEYLHRLIMTSDHQILKYSIIVAICLLLMAYFTRRYLTKLKWFAEQKPTKDRDEKIKWHYHRFWPLIFLLTFYAPGWAFFDLGIWKLFEGINPLLGVLIAFWPFYIYVFYLIKFSELRSIHSRLHNRN